MRHALLTSLLWLAAVTGCSDEEGSGTVAEPLGGTVVVTFNTGTSEAMGHDAPPDDGYSGADANYSDLYYGDGLAWQAVVDDAARFLRQVQPDVIGFQEIFYSGECEMIPDEAKKGFVCERWQPGDPSVAQLILGEGYQIACHQGFTDKCAAVRRSFGSFRGCDADLCLDGLDGTRVDNCGSAARVGRGVIDLVEGGSITLVNVHGTSGLSQEDQDCRAKQFAQVFVDLGLGDGEPAANGEVNLIVGDFNTDPGRNFDFDESAAFVSEHVGVSKRFHFVSDVGSDAAPSYAGLFNIDHVMSDGYAGSCWIAGLSAGHPSVSEVRYFDHKPVVCNVERE